MNDKLVNDLISCQYVGTKVCTADLKRSHYYIKERVFNVKGSFLKIFQATNYLGIRLTYLVSLKNCVSISSYSAEWVFCVRSSLLTNHLVYIFRLFFIVKCWVYYKSKLIWLWFEQFPFKQMCTTCPFSGGEISLVEVDSNSIQSYMEQISNKIYVIYVILRNN